MYKVLVRFKDLQDEHIYSVGDKFPHDDREITAERLEELAGTENKLGVKIIEEVKKDDNDGNMSGTKKLVRPKSAKVSRDVQDN